VELDLKAAHEMFDLNYVILRLTTFMVNGKTLLINIVMLLVFFMNQVLQDQPMTIFGDGLQTRAFSHVDDVALIAHSHLYLLLLIKYLMLG